MRTHTRQSLRQARNLRSDMSLPEVLLWRYLRGKPQGVKFRRQHPLGNFVLDFYCASARIAIEVDGIAHDMGDRPERDFRRDAWLRSQDVDVVRIPASDILRDVAESADAIVRYCAQKPPPPAAGAAVTSPSGGGFSGVKD